MKKILLPFLSCIAILGSSFAQVRYVDEVFTDFTVDNNIGYGMNFSVLAASQGLPYAPTGQDLTGDGNADIPPLEFDLYQPDGDTETERPLVIVLHTGTFAPIIYNGNPTGMRQDIATTLICESYAKRGYVVANLEYRLGWNPGAETPAERGASLMKAVYRAIQDTKGAVRYFRKDYENGNTYGIDTSRIILSGQGSGGWVALGYATVNKYEEITLPKFLDVDEITGEVTALIDTSEIGDWDGYGGEFNNENHPGYSNDVHMICSMGGGIGDLSWLEAGETPMCAVHCPTDPVAIYTTGDVSVTGAGLITTEISGSYDVMTKANMLGNNDVLITVNAGSDAYTLGAQAASASAEGMADFSGTVVGAPVDNVFPYVTANPFEASPWDLWDPAFVEYVATVVLGLPAGTGTGVANDALVQNPDMGPLKAFAYIDTTLGYFCRRIVRATNLDGLASIEASETMNTLEVYPNPASNVLVFRAQEGNIQSIEIHSALGEKVRSELNLSSNMVSFSDLNLKAGLYFCSVEVDGHMFTKKVIIK
ncbi:MAG: T9SS type A sorting domain-containing protein [Crocinitomicaceae bacterium]